MGKVTLTGNKLTSWFIFGLLSIATSCFMKFWLATVLCNGVSHRSIRMSNKPKQKKMIRGCVIASLRSSWSDTT